MNYDDQPDLVADFSTGAGVFGTMGGLGGMVDKGSISHRIFVANEKLKTQGLLSGFGSQEISDFQNKAESLPKKEYLNATALLLGYTLLERGKKVSVERFKKLHPKIKNKDIDVTPESVLRYARFLSTH